MDDARSEGSKTSMNSSNIELTFEIDPQKWAMDASIELLGKDLSSLFKSARGPRTGRRTPAR